MLNENLAKIRKERGLTQEALASKLNVVRQTISNGKTVQLFPMRILYVKLQMH